MGDAYWVKEYIGVWLGYCAVFYLWPSVVFYPYLKGRSLRFRFAFCTLASTVLIPTALTLLGIVKLLDVRVAGVLFYGLFFVQLIRYHDPFPYLAEIFRRLSERTLTLKQLAVNVLEGTRKKTGTLVSNLSDGLKGRKLRFAVLLLVLFYGVAYFSYNSLALHTYGFSDQFTHNSWISSMENGIIYPKGIYPEGMHCMVYAMRLLPGVRTYSVMLFMGGIHTFTILLSAYLMMREIFRWSYTPLFALAAFLTLSYFSGDGISSMSRLTATLPQEFAFPAVFLCAYGLLRILKRPKEKLSEKKLSLKEFSPRELLKDEDLVIFSLSVAYSVGVHFYATIIAVFVCGVIYVLHLLRGFSLRVFLRLAVGVIAACLISVLPIGIALARGYQFQGSLRWAIAVSRGGQEAWAEGRYDPNVDYLAQAEEETAAATEGEGQADAEQAPAPAVHPLRKLYDGTVEQLYPGIRGSVLVGFCIVSVALWLFAEAVTRALHRRSSYTGDTGPLIGYACVPLTCLLLLVAYKPNLAGLPILMAGDRLCVFIHLFGVMAYCCVADLVVHAAELLLPGWVLSLGSAAACVGIYLAVQSLGLFHGYLYTELTRYPAAAELTEEIMQKLPAFKYTIVSPTEELYHVSSSGYHEELYDFVERRRDPSYTIPTPYVFFFIEKQPLDYAQYCFPDGPRWLAGDRYLRTFRVFELMPVTYPEVRHGTVSQELANKTIKGLRRRSEAASVFANREILESKAYVWLERFRRMYPYDGEVVYEDDAFLCYCLKQNEYSLFTLGFMK